MKRYKDFLLETKSGEQAKRLGLKHVGRGMYADPRGNITHKSVGGEKLERLPRDQQMPADQMKGGEKETEQLPPDQGGEGLGNITITFGRFNPPTVGHEKLLKSVMAHSTGGDFRIYPSRSQDPKKNPLDPRAKVSLMKKMFPAMKDHIINKESMRNIFDVLKSLSEEGYTSVTIVVGGDRVGEFDELANKYNGSLYNFEAIDVLSAGERDPDADSIEGMSASKMRDAASKDDFTSFRKGMPKSLKDDEVEKVMKQLQKAMGVELKKPKMETWEVAPKLDQETLRERYIEDEMYPVGSYVENVNTGLSGPVIKRGTNYIIFVDEYDNKHRSWLKDIVEGEDPSTQWEVGTDKYREDVQAMTPGQPVMSFSTFVKKSKKTK
jgi:hypothetical protein